MIGPNCLGILDTYSGVDCVFLPKSRLKRPKKGGISFISQSGAAGSVILDRISKLGVSKFISYGNAMNMNESDFIEYLAKDKHTKIICIYIEQVKDGKRFMRVCKNTKKPIVVLKGGKTEEGAKETVSHTGSLAGDAVVYSGVFKQLGIMEAESINQVENVLKLLVSGIKGKSIGVITNGGGYGILTADALVSAGLPYEGPVVDLLGDASTEGYRKAIKNMKKDIIVCNALFHTPLITEDIIDVFTEAAKKKNILIVSTGAAYIDMMKKRLQEHNVQYYDTPKEAVDALKLLLIK